MATKPLLDSAEVARLMNRATQVAGWGPDAEQVDNILLMLIDPDMSVMHRLHFCCDAPTHCITYNLMSHTSHATSAPTVEKLLDAAALVPRSDWNPETSVTRKGKPGHAVSMSTQNFPKVE